MTNFTPSELIYVAETTMRKRVWRIYKGNVIDNTQGLGTPYNPETNDTQFRALAEWCAVKGFSPNKVESLNNEFAVVVYSTKEVGKYIQVVSTSHTDCMIAAVLAHKQSSESGEVDCE